MVVRFERDARGADRTRTVIRMPSFEQVRDDDALYYLRTRGISESEARRLLIDGFADQVMDDLTDDVLRSWIIERLGHVDA